MSVPKLERLLNLMAALLETPRPLTADQLRQRVPGYPEETASFRRAFERDKDDLRQMGIPLRVEIAQDGRRDREGYRIPPEEYYLGDPGLEADELAALQLAARVVRVVGTATGDDAAGEDETMWKLGGGPQLSENDGQRNSEPLAELPVDPRLTELFSAIVDRHRIHFDYSGGSRSVDPHRLDYERGRWYLSGFDHDRADRRSFRLDRMQGSVTIDTAVTFEPPSHRPGVQLEPWQLGNETPFVARLVVDNDQAPWATRHLGEHTVVVRRPDGAVEFEVTVVNRAAFRSFVLSFLDHAEVLHPPQARADVIEWLTALVEANR